MTKYDVSFDDWFDNLALLLLDAGIEFNDRDSVRQDYDEGRDMYDVLDEIKEEYEQ